MNLVKQNSKATQETQLSPMPYTRVSKYIYTKVGLATWLHEDRSCRKSPSDPSVRRVLCSWGNSLLEFIIHSGVAFNQRCPYSYILHGELNQYELKLAIQNSYWGDLFNIIKFYFYLIILKNCAKYSQKSKYFLSIQK